MSKKYRMKDTLDAIQYDGTRKSLKQIVEFLPKEKKKIIHVIEYPGDDTSKTYIDLTYVGRMELLPGHYVEKKSWDDDIDVFTPEKFEANFEVKE